MTKPKVHANFQFDPERDLRILRDHLYEGSWELMLNDLRARLTQRPMVYKISDNIHADIASIKALMREEGIEVEDDPMDFAESDRARMRKADEVYEGEDDAGAAKDDGSSKAKRKQSKRRSAGGEAAEEAAAAESPRVRRKQPPGKSKSKSKSSGRAKSSTKGKQQPT